MRFNLILESLVIGSHCEHRDRRLKLIVSISFLRVLLLVADTGVVPFLLIKVSISFLRVLLLVAHLTGTDATIESDVSISFLRVLLLVDDDSTKGMTRIDLFQSHS